MGSAVKKPWWEQEASARVWHNGRELDEFPWEGQVHPPPFQSASGQYSTPSMKVAASSKERAWELLERKLELWRDDRRAEEIGRKNMTVAGWKKL